MQPVDLALLAAVALPMLSCVPLAWAGRRLGSRTGWVALLFPLLSTLSLTALAFEAGANPQIVIEWPWVPSLGINLAFLVDGLSLYFGLVVSGAGILVTFYAIFYLDDNYRHHGRFYCYLMLFMAAMLGTIFADNLMLLFVFWELTGLASFLLIGFLHEKEASRTGARQALLVTSLTGLFLLVGILMVGQVTGTYQLSDLLAQTLPMAGHENWLTVAMVLILLGAFGKSAQFPFHFWLPNAMAAPTPVSAYLHSAAMVKLGVFLCARTFPLFVEFEWWAPVLAIVAFTTMALGALLALLSHDLKAILAYSTVSQLGFLLGYYGLGPTGGVEHDYLHILNHVFYKGSLFMIAGIVIHATGLRDIRQLGGLFRRLPMLGVACLIAAAAMAGFPGTIGFLSKEAAFKEIFEAMSAHGALGGFATVCVVTTSLVKVAFSVRLFHGIFLGPEPETVAKHFHAPPPAMQAPPLILAGAALFFGVWPGLLEGPFQYLAVNGLHQPAVPLELWHGFNRELAASSAVVILGLGLFELGRRTGWKWARIPRWLRLDQAFESAIDHLSRFAVRLMEIIRAEKPLDYLPIVFAFTLTVVGGMLLVTFGTDGWNFPFSQLTVDPLRSFVAALIALAVLGVVLLRRWTTQLISLSVAGFLITFYFVLYRAPDLALTQILVEAVTLVLILLLLGRFPKSAETGGVMGRQSKVRRSLNLTIALGVGGLMTALTLWFTALPHPEPMGRLFLQETVDLAAGSNAVNTILVDFRGFDTLGEITVLTIAMLGGLGLLMRHKRTPEEYLQGPMGPPGSGIDHSPDTERTRLPTVAVAGLQGPRSFILQTMTRFAFFLINVFAVYLLLRGHNLPGGGFIAGLATAVSLVLLSLALGLVELHRLIRFDPTRLAACGLLLALVTALLPIFFQHPFLEHFHFHWDVPLIGAVHFGTPLLFDSAVYLVVVGVTTKLIFVLANSVHGLPALVAEEQRRYSSIVEQPIEEAPPGTPSPTSPPGREDMHAT